MSFPSARFDDVYSRAIENNQVLALTQTADGVSPDVKPLLREFFEQASRSPADLQSIKEALTNLLSFLATPEGRTNANCTVVDFFTCIAFRCGDGEIPEWETFPPALRDIIEDIGGALHDTVTHPDIAANFDSTPEQLLERLKKLDLR